MSLCSTHDKIFLRILAFIFGIIQDSIYEHSYCNIFHPIYALLLKLCITNMARPCQLRPGLSFLLFKCIYKKPYII